MRLFLPALLLSLAVGRIIFGTKFFDPGADLFLIHEMASRGFQLSPGPLHEFEEGSLRGGSLRRLNLPHHDLDAPWRQVRLLIQLDGSVGSECPFQGRFMEVHLLPPAIWLSYQLSE
jgi:hypothetical protein